jgi:hypothetical protein
VKMQALRNGVKSLRSDVSTPCWVETGEAGRIGAAEGISGRVIFADFSSRTPGKIYRKNSDSPLRLLFCDSEFETHTRYSGGLEINLVAKNWKATLRDS